MVLEVGQFFCFAKEQRRASSRNISNKFEIFTRLLRRPNLRFSSYFSNRPFELKAAKVVFSRAEARLMDERGTKNAALAAFNSNGGAGSRTRTYEARRREIYSLLSLPLDDSSNKLIIHENSIFSTQNSSASPQHGSLLFLPN